MADPGTLSQYGLTPLSSPTQGATQAGGPLDLAGGTTSTQTYDPFSLGTFGASTFTVSTKKQSPEPNPYDQKLATQADLASGRQPGGNIADTHTVQDFLKDVAGDPAALKSLQYALVGAGFNIDVTGSLDDKTMSVLSSLIGEAQRDGRSLLDVIDAHAKTQTQTKAKSLAAQGQSEFQQQLVAAYVSWWGVPPTQGWIDSALKSGQNLFELEFNEKSKAAYANSPTYQQNHNSIESSLSSGALNTQTFSGAGNPFSPGPTA